MNYKVYLLFLDIFLFLFILGGFFGALWIPTRKKNYERIASLAELKPGMIFYDLGSGSGSLLFYLSKKYNIKCVGIEISPILYLYSKLKSLFFKNVEIKYGNFLRHNLSNANVIYVFLHPKVYDKLKKKISHGIKKDSTLILLSTWPFKDKNPLRINEKNKETTYYLYKKADF